MGKGKAFAEELSRMIEHSELRLRKIRRDYIGRPARDIDHAS